jgi:aspartyl/glutamyl-tRNA(Asn/Gln) amidotransferase C subunit
MDAEELRRTAELAQLSLDDQEFADLSRAAEEVLEFFAVLQETPVSENETADAITSSALRTDGVSQAVPADALLDVAPEVEDRLILIPNVL